MQNARGPRGRTAVQFMLLASSFHTQRLKLSPISPPSGLSASGWKRREVGDITSGSAERWRWTTEARGPLRPGHWRRLPWAGPVVRGPTAEPGVANPTSPGRAENGLGSASEPGQAPKGEIPWPIWGVEEEQFLILKEALTKPPIRRGRSWANFTGGRGDCLSLARKLPAPGRPAGHCGVAAQVTPPADVEPLGLGELARGPSSALRDGGLVLLGLWRGRGGERSGGFKRMDQKTHGGDGRGGKRKVIKKKNLLSYNQ